MEDDNESNGSATSGQGPRRAMAPKIFQPLPPPHHVLITLVVTIFLAEVLVMLILDQFAPLPDYVEAAADAAMLSVFLAPILYLFVYRPLNRHSAARELAMQAALQSAKRFADIAENTNEWIWEVDATGKYTYASPVCERILGYSVEEIMGKYFYDLFHPEDREQLKAGAFEVFASKQPFVNFINRNVRKDGKSVWLETSGVPVLGEQGELLGYRGSDTVKHEENSLTDALTGVLNRQGFSLLAEQQLRLAIRNRLPAAVLFGDMDNLKPINDHFGHTEGDRALQQMARILSGALRESDTIGRYGGDEFVMLLSGVTAENVERVVINNIVHRVKSYNEASKDAYDLSVSIGVALYDPAEPKTLEDLIREADRKMYQQKKSHHRERQEPAA